MSMSVSPSAKKSCVGSPLRFSNGSTTSEREPSPDREESAFPASVVGAAPPSPRSARATAAASGKRRSGAFSRQRITSSSSSRETEGFASRRLGAGSWTMRYMVAATSPPLNTGRPAAISHSSRPMRVDVGARVDRELLQLLGRHVRHRAREGSRVARGGGPGGIERARDDVREAEVEQLGAASGRDRDVAGLQVAVHDALLVRGLQRLGHLDPDRAPSRFGQRAIAQHVGQRASRHELHDDEIGAGVRVEVEQRRDARVQQSRKRARLGLEAPPRLVVGERPCSDHLDRDVAVEARVAGAPDDAHAALPQALEDLVPPQRVADHAPMRSCGSRGWRREDPDGHSSVWGRGEPALPVRPVAPGPSITMRARAAASAPGCGRTIRSAASSARASAGPA